jgi:hypothetical protein
MSKRRLVTLTAPCFLIVGAVLYVACASENDAGRFGAQQAPPTIETPSEGASDGSAQRGGGKLCADLISGELMYNQQCTVAVDTSPSHAIATSSEDSCTTPCRLKIHGDAKTIIISREGYKSETVPLRRNVFFGPGGSARMFPSVTIGLIEEK